MTTETAENTAAATAIATPEAVSGAGTANPTAVALPGMSGNTNAQPSLRASRSLASSSSSLPDDQDAPDSDGHKAAVDAAAAAAPDPGRRRRRISQGGSMGSSTEEELNNPGWRDKPEATNPFAGPPPRLQLPLTSSPPPSPPAPARRGWGLASMARFVLRRGSSPPPPQQGPPLAAPPAPLQQPQGPWWQRLTSRGGASGSAVGTRSGWPGAAGLNRLAAQLRGERPQLSAARAILQQAAKLPPHRRHELLSAAAALPELAPVFAAAAAAAVTAPGAAETDLARPEAPTLPELPDLEARLRAMRKAIAASPCPPPAPAPGAHTEAEQQGGGDTGAAAAPPNGDALTLALVPEYEQYGVAAGEAVRAVVSIKAAAEVRQRAHVALTCVLDRSGSMSGERLELVRETAHFLIDQLADRDYLGLISYTGQVREDLPLLRMSREAKALAHAVVDGLYASGSTALYDGLVAGVRQQMEAQQELGKRRARRGGVRGAARQAAAAVAEAEEAEPALVHSCFLFTDGQATDGPSQPNEILAGLAALQAPSGAHVTVHTFGFGEGHSVELLQAVADAQSGVYYFIAGSEDIAGGFGDALGGLLAVVAKDIRVTVRPAPGCDLAAFRSGGRVIGAAGRVGGGGGGGSLTRRGGRADSSAEAQGSAAAAGAAAVPSGAAFNDMFAEESRECLLLLNLPAAAPTAAAAADAADAAAPQPEERAASEEVAHVELQYTDVASGARVTRAAALRVERRAADRPAGQLPAELVFVTAARFETLDAIEAAQAAAAAAPDGDDVGGAHAVLDAQLARLATAPLRSAALTALSEQTRAARENIRPRHQFNQLSSAAVAGTVQALRQQRVGTASEAAAAQYASIDHACKARFRQTTSAVVGSTYMSKLKSKCSS